MSKYKIWQQCILIYLIYHTITDKIDFNIIRFLALVITGFLF